MPLSRIPLATVALLAFGYAGVAGATEPGSLTDLQAATHIHGIAVDQADPDYLLVATHHGLFRAGPDGKIRRISIVQDFMGFTPHPTEAGVLFASGHPAHGGNLGFVMSTDAGQTWNQISGGVEGPADFHQLTVSAAEPATIYGAFRGLQRSRDGGKSWEIVGPAPDRLIDLAASARQKDTLYAATESGLLVSRDAGGSWTPVMEAAPVTMIEPTSSGTLYAFVYGEGLMQSPESAANWTRVGGSWGEQFILDLAIDSDDPLRMFAATGQGQVLASKDGGENWTAFGG